MSTLAKLSYELRDSLTKLFYKNMFQEDAGIVKEIKYIRYKIKITELTYDIAHQKINLN